MEDIDTDVFGESGDAIVVSLSDDAKSLAVVAPVDRGARVLPLKSLVRRRGC